VGLTAGTSTPDAVIDGVETRIRLYADGSAEHVRQVEKRKPQIAGGLR
jgi:4-hydroxy-3-methylbut-2-enyl diphosphate reductase IspH